jgi:hypothetical protein
MPQKCIEPQTVTGQVVKTQKLARFAPFLAVARQAAFIA